MNRWVIILAVLVGGMFVGKGLAMLEANGDSFMARPKPAAVEPVVKNIDLNNWNPDCQKKTVRATWDENYDIRKTYLVISIPGQPLYYDTIKVDWIKITPKKIDTPKSDPAKNLPAKEDVKKIEPKIEKK